MHEDRSSERYAGLTDAGRRLAFVLSLWISLATAVICAVMPAGLPATRAIGSAFDPSTTIVALRSRPPVAKPALLRAGDDDAGNGIRGLLGQIALPPAAPSPLFAPGFARTAVTPSPFFLPIPRAIDTALYARPPPTL